MITYQLSHPDLSHPLEIDSHVEREPRSLASWAMMHILRELDEVLPVDEWEVVKLN